MCKFPNVSVCLPDTSNVCEAVGDLYITQRVSDMLKQAGVPRDQIGEYLRDALSQDRLHLLTVTQQWVRIY